MQTKRTFIALCFNNSTVNTVWIDVLNQFMCQIFIIEWECFGLDMNWSSCYLPDRESWYIFGMLFPNVTRYSCVYTFYFEWYFIHNLYDFKQHINVMFELWVYVVFFSFIICYDNGSPHNYILGKHRLSKTMSDCCFILY